MCACVCVFVCVYVCVYVCVCARYGHMFVCACVQVHVCGSFTQCILVYMHNSV